MSNNMVDLQCEWRDLSEQPEEDQADRTRELMSRIASAGVNDNQDAAFKLKVAVEYLDDGEQRDHAILPEDRALRTIIASVMNFLTSWKK